MKANGWWLLLALLGSGCEAFYIRGDARQKAFTKMPRFAHPAPSVWPLPPPPPGSAQVVFLYPSELKRSATLEKYGAYNGETIVDENRRFVANSFPRSHVVVLVPAGKHFFASCCRGRAWLEADLADGKTYYVEVAPIAAPVAGIMERFLALRPGGDHWDQREQWVRELPRWDADRAEGQKFMDGYTDWLDWEFTEVRKTEASTQSDRLPRFTLRPEDGS